MKERKRKENLSALMSQKIELNSYLVSNFYVIPSNSLHSYIHSFTNYIMDGGYMITIRQSAEYHDEQNNVIHPETTVNLYFNYKYSFSSYFLRLREIWLSSLIFP